MSGVRRQMLIGGLQKLSLLDYPGHIAAIVFTQGCNFRCQFCYNPQLVVFTPVQSSVKGSQKDYSQMSKDSLFGFLKKRKGKLDSVVITGGEPLIHNDLPQFIAKIKKLDYLVKLDTNGTNLAMLQQLIDKKLIDYIAMDLKAPLEKYQEITGVRVSLNNIRKSIKIIMNSGGGYEFRTTMVPGLQTKKDIKAMGQLIKGAAKWYLQKFHSNTDLVNSNLKNQRPYTDKEMREFKGVAEKYVKQCEIR